MSADIGQNQGEGSEALPKNPCVRNCCLDDQDVCLGCGRSLKEITGWSKLDARQREVVLNLARKRLEERRGSDGWVT